MHKKVKHLTPNEETIEAMKAARRGDVIKVKDREDLFKQLETNKLMVSDRDFETIIDALENPPKPTQAMKDAMEKHQRAYHGSDEE